ncbi:MULTISPECIES: cell division protein ZipA C-terminal FtsZ-binding domain-containing protein [unclassified Undibacterium]|uniref:cell division protein ZipA C-terminal FtsZ-binding domain-containing protein n=2 Tax=Bacteria TaxID=2 RepID=UPI002AC92E65|nr:MULTISPECIES: cell division protein ZipA C-terminal FtsZ-binding domain-containing protein [unclassified Undibacterium]MEB0138555.1 cell division protein ZipA C-terminal FtsZ-binding domain-containing protein [Undibacterium sp. CCC2.1]MEB0171381.1 cell division protein ZipA C-terminal FtsZ-binding domain-containing protein [Undibacterium sp. CCC1.1]MEB0175319.1 cell division protein ZipA C-terminal FtsZ-binding domain-containing protein [Undibacterium sp. CCC3.4]MEB0214577.1 cell division pr
MTDFQLSLLAVGGSLVVAVVVFNKWQEYKAKKTVDNAFADGGDDVLLQPSAAITDNLQRQEPVLDDGPSAVAECEELAVAPPSESAAESHTTPRNSPEKELPVDELIDCVVPLEFETPVRGEKILSEIAELKYIGKKPVHFIGLCSDGQRDVIATGSAYTSLFAGIQMVSRSGPLSELEYSEFIMKLRAIADNLNAHPDIPDMTQVILQARELHHFVAEHDAQLSVNIAANGAPWALNTLLSALEKMGFDQRPDGRLMMPDGEGGSLFTLSTNVGVSETLTARLTLLLDVPCVAPSRDGFGAMAACARSLATRLGGTVVDDGNAPISKAALDEIAGQVNEFYAAMAESQIAAGSVRAQRLFS